jgi:hypothetical protein
MTRSLQVTSVIGSTKPPNFGFGCWRESQARPEWVSPEGLVSLTTRVPLGGRAWLNRSLAVNADF